MAASAITYQQGAGNFFTGSFTLDVGSLTTGAFGTETAAIPDVKVGDLCFVHERAAATDIILLVTAYCLAAGTLSMRFVNPTAGTVNKGSSTFDFLIVRGASAPSWAG